MCASKKSMDHKCWCPNYWQNCRNYFHPKMHFPEINNFYFVFLSHHFCPYTVGWFQEFMEISLYKAVCMFFDEENIWAKFHVIWLTFKSCFIWPFLYKIFKKYITVLGKFDLKIFTFGFTCLIIRLLDVVCVWI